MATWPGTLPDDFLVDAFSETLPDNTIRSKVEYGPAKLRRRATAAVRPIEGQLYMTTAQVATHDTFFVTTLKYGSLAFDWTHPRTGSSKSFRYVGVPNYSPSGINWIAALVLEILP